MICSCETARAAFAFEIPVLKAEPPMSRGQQRAAKRLAAILSRWLEVVGPRLVRWAVEQLERTQTTKADIPDPDASDLYDAIQDVLVSAAESGVLDTAQIVVVDLDTPSVKATLYARQRAAELVGKKLINGVLIDNPNGEWVISNTLRDVVRDKVSTAIVEGWSPDKLTESLRSQFGDRRAETIARTETGYAYGNGAAEVYTEFGAEFVEILDGEGCLPNGHVAGAPKASGDPGVVEEESEANGQVWTVAQYQAAILGHPNCVRAAVPWFSDGRALPVQEGAA